TGGGELALIVVDTGAVAFTGDVFANAQDYSGAASASVTGTVTLDADGGAGDVNFTGTTITRNAGTDVLNILGQTAGGGVDTVTLADVGTGGAPFDQVNITTDTLDLTGTIYANTVGGSSTNVTAGASGSVQDAIDMTAANGTVTLASGATYDEGAAITIGVNGLTLAGAGVGSTIDTGGLFNGIVINADNVTIQNLTVNNNDIGISGSGLGTETATITNVAITNNSGLGFDVDTIATLNLSEITLTDNNGSAGTAGTGGDISNVTTVNFTTGSGDDDISINSTDFTHTGNQAITHASVNEFTFNGGDGNDTLTVDFSAGGNWIPAGGITFNGQGNTGPPGDSLTLQNSAPLANVTHTFINTTSGSIAISGGGAVNYTGLEPIFDNTDAVDRVFNFADGNQADIILSDDGTPNDNYSRIASASSAETVDFLHPTNSLTVNGDSGGTGDDTITVSGLDIRFGASLVLDGNNGTDIVTLSSALNDTVLSGVGGGLTGITVTAETINLNAAGIAAQPTVETSGAQSYTGAVVLGDDVVLDGAGITITGTVEADVAANNRTLELNSGAANTISVTSTVGAAQPLAGLTITQSNGATFGGAVDVTQTAAGTIAISDTQAGQTVSFTGDVDADTLTVLGTGNAYNVSFTGATTDITGAGSTTFSNTGGVTLGDSGDTLTFVGGLTATAGTGVSVGGTVQSNGAAIALDTVTLTDNSTIDATNGPTATGGAITLSTSVDADDAGLNDRTLALNSGTANTISVTGTVGAAQPLAGLTITQSNGATFSNTVDVSDGAAGTIAITDTQGAQTVSFTNTVLADALTVAGTGNAYNVSFTGATTDIT
ncbi:beta strand repeat-containing protein, partial [Thermodesulfobacteriota bacterium]